MGIYLTKEIYTKGTWQEVVDDCRSTVHKPPLGHEPSNDFKRKILIAEHSPIRDITVRWKWLNIPYWIAMHWKTHHWESKVSTQRTDRTGIDRDNLPQNAPVDFTGEANCQHLIDTMRKRLCHQASPETRAYAEDLKAAITELEPEIGHVLVPNCIYRCGCPEMESCGLWSRFLKWCKESDEQPDLLRKIAVCELLSTSISRRYDFYHEYMASHKEESAND